METENMSMHKIEEVSPNQDSHASPSCLILQELAGVYINPKGSISEDDGLQHLKKDSNSETPDRYPPAPHTSPIDIHNYHDSLVFDVKLRECLRNLPNILVSSNRPIIVESPKLSGFYSENSIGSYAEISTSVDLYKNESAESSSCVAITQMKKLDLLRVDSDIEINTDLYRISPLNDEESMIVNWCSDESNISLEDVSDSSDDNFSSVVRDRIEFEALAIDSAVNPNIFRKLQQWKIRSKNKRSLSVGDCTPSKILNNSDFSKPKFELNI